MDLSSIGESVFDEEIILYELDDDEILKFNKERHKERKEELKKRKEKEKPIWKKFFSSQSDVPIEEEMLGSENNVIIPNSLIPKESTPLFSSISDSDDGIKESFGFLEQNIRKIDEKKNKDLKPNYSSFKPAPRIPNRPNYIHRGIRMIPVNEELLLEIQKKRKIRNQERFVKKQPKIINSPPKNEGLKLENQRMRSKKIESKFKPPNRIQKSPNHGHLHVRQKTYDIHNLRRNQRRRRSKSFGNMDFSNIFYEYSPKQYNTKSNQIGLNNRSNEGGINPISRSLLGDTRRKNFKKRLSWKQTRNNHICFEKKRIESKISPKESKESGGMNGVLNFKRRIQPTGRSGRKRRSRKRENFEKNFQKMVNKN